MKYPNLIDKLKIASPCSANWDKMLGNERRRYCGQCKLNVYNLSGMSKQEAERFMSESEDTLCVRFYRRADGTVITKDCPVGWRDTIKRILKLSTAFVSILFGFLGGIATNELFSSDQINSRTTVSSKISSEEQENVKRIHKFDREKLRRILKLLKKLERKDKYEIMGRVPKLKLHKNTKKTSSN